MSKTLRPTPAAWYSSTSARRPGVGDDVKHPDDVSIRGVERVHTPSYADQVAARIANVHQAVRGDGAIGIDMPALLRSIA